LDELDRAHAQTARVRAARDVPTSMRPADPQRPGVDGADLPEPDVVVSLSAVEPLARRLGLGAVDPLLLRLGVLFVVGLLMVPVALSLRGRGSEGTLHAGPAQAAAGASTAPAEPSTGVVAATVPAATEPPAGAAPAVASTDV